MVGAGFGLKLHDAAHGTNHLAPFTDWVQFAQGAYLDLGGDQPPARITTYYDPLLDIHLRASVAGGFGVAFYLAPIAPEVARAIYDAAVAKVGLGDASHPGLPFPRTAAQALFLAKEWGLTDLTARLQASIDTMFQPTWHDANGEFTWGCGLDEEHPRGQYNAFLAAAEAVSKGAWTTLAAGPPPSGEGLITGLDFPAVACREARWQDGVLHCVLTPQSERLAGDPTTFRVTGLAEPDAWRASGPAEIRTRRDGADLVIETPVTTEEIRVLRR